MWQPFKYFHLTTTPSHGKGPHQRNGGGMKYIQGLTTIWKENQEMLTSLAWSDHSNICLSEEWAEPGLLKNSILATHDIEVLKHATLM